MIGIIGAMDEEVAKIKEQMDRVEIKRVAGMDFFQGLLGKCEVVVVRSGIGKVNAAICSQILADCYHVTAIINTGIAGSLRKEINIGDVVLSTDALHHDMDTSSFGDAPGQVPRMDVLAFRADGHLLEVAESCCKKYIPEIGVHTGRVLSGDQFISDKKKKQWLLDTFGGFCTEMEGAAIAHTAYLNGIPYLIIRAISDKADDTAHVDYPEFEAAAIRHSVKLLTAMIGELA